MTEKPSERAPKKIYRPNRTQSGMFLYVLMPLALVAWQALAVGRLLRTRESSKPLSGRESALKSHFYVR